MVGGGGGGGDGWMGGGGGGEGGGGEGKWAWVHVWWCVGVLGVEVVVVEAGRGMSSEYGRD